MDCTNESKIDFCSSSTKKRSVYTTTNELNKEPICTKATTYLKNEFVELQERILTPQQ